MTCAEGLKRVDSNVYFVLVMCLCIDEQTKASLLICDTELAVASKRSDVFVVFTIFPFCLFERALRNESSYFVHSQMR